MAPPLDTASRLAARIAFVLVEPRSEGNVGAAARAIKNGGFRKLRLVRPPPLGADAAKMAWKSLDVLRAAKRFDSLEEAIRDAHVVAGFTARPRRDTREVLDLRAAAPRLVAGATGGKVALLFGREDRGLTTDELAPCSFLVSIPAARARMVYNLSQAVLLAAYELREHLARDPASAPGEDGSAPAAATPPLTAGARAVLLARLRELLVALRYDVHPDPGLLERIATRAGRLLDRAHVDSADQALLLGLLRRIEGRIGPRG